MKKSIRTILILLTICALLILAYAVIPDVSRDLNKYGRLVYDRNGKILRAFLNDDEQWCFEPVDNKIPPKLEKVVLLYEDRWFYRHPGFNPVSIIQALVTNIKAGRVISGGSTITMQVCRLARPGNRTVIKKFSELLQAIKLEIKYSKKQILSMYLNNAPYGGNIVGIRAASLKYFGREPEHLSWAEAAVLAVLPNNPGRISPASNYLELKNKRNRLLDKLRSEAVIDEQTRSLSCLEPVPENVLSLPCQAPHLTRMLEASTEKKQIFSTIDLELQLLVEKVVSFRFPYLQKSGIKNLSVLVADNRNREILVWIGSQDFYDQAAKGKVDGVLAERSPGSTLKPFLYALAMDEGLIVPSTQLADVPTYFKGFQPENASRNYDGWVSAHSALVRSLNIPAVRLLNLFGYARFYRFLEDAGISSLFRTPAGYGLTLIIGGCEVNMLELAALYCSLANYGEFMPLSFLKDQKVLHKAELISPGSCWQVLNILSQLQRPGYENYWHQYDNQWQLAWKTGTSYGHRDAWAIGVNPQYTIAVWAGNFDSHSNPAVSGAASAGPVLFAVSNVLPRDADQAWFEMPLNQMEERQVCAQTGFAPSRWCERDTILVSQSARPLRMCAYHQPFQITNDGKNTVCSLCWHDTPHHQEVFLVYPPQVSKYLNLKGFAMQEIPPHKKNCPSASAANISIDYPQPGAIIFLPRDLDLRQQKLTPQLSGFHPETKIFWYLDDEFLGVTSGRENLPLLPDSGIHTLSLIDESGYTVSTSFEIILPQ